MRHHFTMLSLYCLLFGCGQPADPGNPVADNSLLATQQTAVPVVATTSAPTDLVATILGQPVKRSDCLSPSQGIGSVEVGIYNLVLQMLMEDFGKSQRVTLSKDEIDAFWKTLRAGAERSNPDPSKPLPEPVFDEAAAQARLKQAQDKLTAIDVPLLERLAWQSQVTGLQRAMELKSPAAMTAYENLLPLRFEAALYKKYGGKVVARQISLQAAGAWLKLAEEAQANGRLVFHDEALKQAFWKHLQDDLAHPEVPPERVDFSLPAWMQFAAQSPPAIAPMNSSAARIVNDPGMTANGQDAPKRSAELQVLDHFVGIWDFDVTNTPATGAAITGKTSETRTWTLGGKFVQFENPQTEKPDEPEFQMLVTYDPATKDYPGVLMSGPTRAVVTGTWDQKTLTMTFRGTFSDGSGTKFEYASRFLDSDHCESSGMISGATGEVIVKQIQKQARRKK